MVFETLDLKHFNRLSDKKCCTSQT